MPGAGCIPPACLRVAAPTPHSRPPAAPPPAPPLQAKTAELATCNTNLDAKTGELETCNTSLDAKTAEVRTPAAGSLGSPAVCCPVPPGPCRLLCAASCLAWHAIHRTGAGWRQVAFSLCLAGTSCRPTASGPSRFPALQAAKCATDLADTTEAKDAALAAQAAAEAAQAKCTEDLTAANTAKDEAVAAAAQCATDLTEANTAKDAAVAAAAQCAEDLTASQGTVRRRAE